MKIIIFAKIELIGQKVYNVYAFSLIAYVELKYDYTV